MKDADAEEKKPADENKAAPEPPPADKLSVTRHRARIGGRDLDYTVTCGTIVLKEEAAKDGKAESDKARASVFFVAYTLDGAPVESRPVTFSFNGGPGSSSVWLHLGLLGPKRVELDDEGHAPPPPAAWWRTSTRSSTAPTSCSSTPSAPATAAWWPARRSTSSTSTSATSRAWASSSASTARATCAGRAPST